MTAYMSNFSNFFFFVLLLLTKLMWAAKNVRQKERAAVEKVGHDRFCDPLGVVLFFFTAPCPDDVALFPGNEAISQLLCPCASSILIGRPVAYRFVRTRAVMSRCRAVRDNDTRPTRDAARRPTGFFSVRGGGGEDGPGGGRARRNRPRLAG